MKILVIGSGGREHALVWKIKQSKLVKKIYCAPGNAGMARDAECVALKTDDFGAIADFVNNNGIKMTVVGPEAPLASGIVDYFRAQKLEVFGPDKKAAQFEASKVFAKDFMRKYGIPTALYKNFTDLSVAMDTVNKWPAGMKMVIKADGLAAGKGVIICEDGKTAEDALRQIMQEKVFGNAGSRVVIEEYLEGEEASVQVFTDGKSYSLMIPAQDHKRVNDNDAGPNTGGMGAYAPAPVADKKLLEKVEQRILKPFMNGIKQEGIDYKGVLYIGLMINKGEPYVLEFNCRFGDPETQVVLPLLKTDLVEIIRKICSGALDKIKIEWYNNTAVCVVLASGGYPGEYKKGLEIKGLSEAASLKNVTVFHAGTSASETKTVTSGGRVLGVTGTGGGIKEAIAKAYEAVNKVSFDGMHFRRDIGKKALNKLS
ncbi:MAG: phosphoribosylamine--glycine ligase [Elusimicrobiota bacterium]